MWRLITGECFHGTNTNKHITEIARTLTNLRHLTTSLSLAPARSPPPPPPPSTTITKSWSTIFFHSHRTKNIIEVDGGGGWVDFGGCGGD